jgi:nucleoside-diphosphate-sugar epimerase
VKVLVTGGHGFVGSHLVERLVAGGDEVRCLSRRTGVPERLAGLPVEVVAGDLESGSGLAAAVRGVDEVWHLGALTRSRTRRQMLRVNHEATLALARHAADAGLTGRFVFCSSLAAVGPAVGGQPHEEAAALRPVTTYGQSKRLAEVGLGGLAGSLPWVVVRPPGVYGPRDKDFLGLFQAVARGIAPLLGEPGRRLSLIHVEDLAAGMLAVGRAPGALHRPWFITSDPPVSQSMLVDALAQAVGRRPRRLSLPTSAARLLGSVSGLAGQLSSGPPLLTRERIAELGEGHWICSGEGAWRVAGWKAGIELGEGLRRTAAWYRAEGLLP